MRTRQEKRDYLNNWAKNKRENDPIWIAKKKAIEEKFNLMGQIFGKWTVIAKAGIKNQASCWLCKCECGTEKVLYANTLRSGLSKSCGCWKGELITKSKITHGDRESKEYHAWCSMKARCYNPNNSRYHHYGDKGIIVCDRWLNSYENFLEDMGRCPDKKLSLDRKRTDGIYEKSNCRWADDYTQANNKTTNKFITYQGETLTIRQWTRKLNIDRSIFYRKKYKDEPKEKIIDIFYKKYMSIAI